MTLKENYLDNQSKRVILDGKCSSWKIILSGIPQGSSSGPLLFFIYINDLPNRPNPICKIFADDASIFTKVFDKDKPQRGLNNDLSIIFGWAFHWKMEFNPDPNNKLIKFTFLGKLIQMIISLLS